MTDQILTIHGCGYEQWAVIRGKVDNIGHSDELQLDSFVAALMLRISLNLLSIQSTRFHQNEQMAMAAPSPEGEVNKAFAGSEDEICVSLPEESDTCQNLESPAPALNGAPKTNESPKGPRARTVIHVSDACKTYGRGNTARHILRGLAMAVEEHTIYGLLGSSGCGKTTLLSCIVALRKLDSGSILVCGQPTGSPGSGIPGARVGYMPQEIALNPECTIPEVLTYFGRIYGMRTGEIRDRHEYLVDLLSLDGLTQQRVEQLSTGQQRRVSMAVALLHEPEILILDEPTVGCDPLLRDSIWSYLHELVAKKASTVVVTTHYIEEMRQADRVGIMRSGRLLCEDSPVNLLQIYKEDLLDTVVVKLCQKDEKTLEGGPGNGRGPRRASAYANVNVNVNGEMALQSVGVGDTGDTKRSPSTKAEIEAEWKRNRNKTNDKIRKPTTSALNRLHALLVKNLLVIMRNLLFTICLICIPASTVLVFCLAVGADPSDLRIGVVNEETGICLSNYTTRFTGAGDENSGCLSPVDLSCEYLLALDPDSITLVQMESEDQAIEATTQARLWGYVKFGPDFSQSFYTRVVEADASSNETIAGSQIDVRLDMTGAQNGFVLQKLLINGYRKLTQNLLESCGIDATGRDLPVTFGAPIHGEADAKLTDYMGPGIGLGFIFFMCALQCGLTYIHEKKDGMIDRTTVAGVGKIEIMLSHFVVQLCAVALIQIGVAFIIIYIVFNVSLNGSLGLCFVLLVANSMAGMSLGFLLATFCSDEKYAMLLAMATVFPNFLIAGVIWPIEGLPPALKTFSYILPCTLTGEAFRSISLRGFDVSHPNVCIGFVSAFSWMAVYWLIILLWHKWAQRKQ